MSRKEMERMQRRRLLLEAAERVFGRKPFDEATMQEVAAEAQIGMQGLYEHFPSKQALYESLIMERVKSFGTRVEKALEPGQNPIQRLRAWATVHAESFSGTPAFFPVFLREKIHRDWEFASRFGPALHEAFGREEARLTEIMKAAAEEGQIQKLEVPFLVRFFLAALHASLFCHIRYNPDEEVSACVNRAMNSFLRGVARIG
jgi:AcrR family transcriptional regulator